MVRTQQRANKQGSVGCFMNANLVLFGKGLPQLPDSSLFNKTKTLKITCFKDKY